VNKKISIAIDGYSSCGKSTLAKALARKLHYNYLDTGAMYRAVTLHAIKEGFFKDDLLYVDNLIDSLQNIELHFEYNQEHHRSEIFLNGKNVETEIRQLEVASKVSEVSAVPEVRKKLQHLQREIGKNKAVVMDGRDIGTVVIPDAELKIFMTADEEIRTKRRFEELRAQGKDLTMNEVRENLKHRDYIDTHRAEDPLRQAEDALLLDNSKINQEEQLTLVLGWVDEILSKIPAN